MSTDVLLLKDISLGHRVKIARAVAKLRQIDVASMATLELERRGLGHMKVTPLHVSRLESEWIISRQRQRAILAVLGVENPDD